MFANPLSNWNSSSSRCFFSDFVLGFVGSFVDFGFTMLEGSSSGENESSPGYPSPFSSFWVALKSSLSEVGVGEG